MCGSHHRSLMLRMIDPHYYAAYLGPDTLPLSHFYGNWGQTKLLVNNPLVDTQPSQHG